MMHDMKKEEFIVATSPAHLCFLRTIFILRIHHCETLVTANNFGTAVLALFSLGFHPYHANKSVRGGKMKRVRNRCNERMLFGFVTRKDYFFFPTSICCTITNLASTECFVNHSSDRIFWRTVQWRRLTRSERSVVDASYQNQVHPMSWNLPTQSIALPHLIDRSGSRRATSKASEMVWHPTTTRQFASAALSESG